jgi:hypothetical protein
MRAILLLLIVGAAACGSDSDSTPFELDIAVDAPAASSVLVDAHTLPPTGGTVSQGFPSLSDASSVHGTVTTLGADGSVRAMAPYELGSYCAAQKPLLRQTLHFVEAADSGGTPALTLDMVQCEKTDGSGVIITP